MLVGNSEQLMLFEAVENRKTSVDAMYCIENGERFNRTVCKHKLYSWRTHRNHNGVALASSTEPSSAFPFAGISISRDRFVSIHLRGIHFCVVANVKCTFVRHSVADTHTSIWNRAKPICLQPTRREENRFAFAMCGAGNASGAKWAEIIRVFLTHDWFLVWHWLIAVHYGLRLMGREIWCACAMRTHWLNWTKGKKKMVESRPFFFALSLSRLVMWNVNRSELVLRTEIMRNSQ